MKKIKGLKKVKKFGIGKFLVMALVLGGGLIYGTQMVQRNQENRSSAATPKQTCVCSNPKYKTIYLCIKNKAKWICPRTTTPVRNCSDSNCGSCLKPAECNNAGCMWNSKTNVCVKKSIDRSVTPGEKMICTSVIYSTWSPCNNGIQTRTIFEKNPSGCTVENPILKQTCNTAKPTSSKDINSVACTSVMYSTWSPCRNGIQTRSIWEKNPSGCTVENPVLKQSCSN